tara:strand:+ start:2751 stop:2966 length:216 start_codon:yes stop_codon:yes gene_type:complete
MKKEIYRSLLPLVNEKDMMDRLKEYANSRITYFHHILELEKNPDRVLGIQGAIAELRRINTLREEVIKGSE